MNNAFRREDFENQNEVRWCPGCGDYAILKAIQCVLPELGKAPHEHVFVSGIGCAGRLPYYMNTYGFHTIHGRAAAIATGLAIMRPDITVWIITGDGDALSIGTNHLIHCLRRNVNVNILLINNEVYGLTKGQFSPTSKPGQITKTSPHGVNQAPLNPLKLALAAGATFVARALDKDQKQLTEVLKRAWHHQGCSFVEIYQDCHIFNSGAFDAFALKTNRMAHTLSLIHGQPMIYGDNRVLQLSNDAFLTENYHSDQHSYPLHDESNFMAAMRLSMLNFPDFPVPLGIYYQKEASALVMRMQEPQKDIDDLKNLYRARASWQSV